MIVSFPRRSGRHPQRPEMFQAWEARFPNTNGGLAAAAKALVDGYKGFYEQYQKISADQTATEGARLVKSAKAARARLIPLIESLDVASEAASQHAAQLEAKTALAYNPPDKKYETCMRHQEMRAHFKSLPQGDRLRMLEVARKEGDEDTLIAVASCQSYLSGVPPQMHQFMRAQLIEAHAPNEAAALKSIREQQSLAAQFRETMLSSTGNLIDFAKADELMALASDELAA